MQICFPAAVSSTADDTLPCATCVQLENVLVKHVTAEGISAFITYAKVKPGA
jgi:hypothetical protein